MQLWLYRIENLGFLLLEFGKQHLLVSCLGFAVALMICRLWRYQRSSAEPFVWAVLFLWLALSPLWLALLSIIPEKMALPRQSLLGQPCAEPIYNRFSNPLPWAPQLSWNMAVITAWFLCASAVGCSWLSKRQRFRHMLTMASRTPAPEVLHGMEEWRLRLGIRRPVRLLISAEVAQAFTIGIFRPVVVLPEWLLREPDGPQLQAVIGHEMAHIKRCDDLWVILEALVRAALWFNPLMRRGARALRQIRECESDRLAVQRGNLDPREYAQTLLALSAHSPSRAVAPELGFGAHQGELPGRINALVSQSHSMNLRAVLTTTLFLAGVALILGFGASNSIATPSAEHDRQLLQSLDPGPPMHAATITRNPHIGHRASCQIGSNPPHHPGMDLRATLDPKVGAIQQGVVIDVSASRSGYEGGNIRIRHQNGLSSIYAHLENIRVKPGDVVAKGTIIGEVGNSRYLHFEVHHRNRSLDISSLANP